MPLRDLRPFHPEEPRASDFSLLLLGLYLLGPTIRLAKARAIRNNYLRKFSLAALRGAGASRYTLAHLLKRKTSHWLPSESEPLVASNCPLATSV
jgi:hypothetical protein